MALPKMQRVFAAAAVVALLMAGAPGRAEAAGAEAGLTGAVSEIWSSFWDWVLGPSSARPRGGDETQGGGNEGRGHRPAFVPVPDVDKGSGLDPNGGNGGGDD